MHVIDNFVKLEEALDLLDKLTERAIEVVEKAPYWTYVENQEWAVLDITAQGEAKLVFFDITIEYDNNPVITSKEIIFPAELLFISEDEFISWQKNQLDAYNKAAREREAKVRVDMELEERAIFERLKAKYE